MDVYFGGVFDEPGWIAPDPSPRAKKVTQEISGSRRGDKLYKYTFSKPESIGPSQKVEWRCSELTAYHQMGKPQVP